MELEIRGARESELAQIGDITVAAYEAAGLLPPQSNYASTLRDATTRFAHSPILVAYDPRLSRLLGSVTLCLYKSPLAELTTSVDELEIRMLSVAPQAQGRGVGVALLQACVAQARQRGCARVVLYTQNMPTETSAMRLYERFGFRYVPERDWHPLPTVQLRAMSLDVARASPR